MKKNLNEMREANEEKKKCPICGLYYIGPSAISRSAVTFGMNICPLCGTIESMEAAEIPQKLWMETVNITMREYRRNGIISESPEELGEWKKTTQEQTRRKGSENSAS